MNTAAGGGKNLRIPELKMPSMTANEKKMWGDYARARNARSPAALKAWARKYNVKLKSKNRVKFARSYRSARATIPPQTPPVGSLPYHFCSYYCLERFDTTARHRNLIIGISCQLYSCKNDPLTSSVICEYQCIASDIRSIP
jgi:hypothetical protein